MSLLDLFNECTSGPWTTSGLDVQYKLVGRTIYFQCSKGKSDWLNNFRFGIKAYSSGDFKAHRGFVEMWQSVRHEIESLDFDRIVGYSQGAAIALFAHENFYHRKGYQPETFCFGMPRVLFLPASDILSRVSNIVRIKNPHDIVTTVPPAILGFRHAGIKKSLTGEVKKTGGLDWFSHHTPREYRARLALLAAAFMAFTGCKSVPSTYSPTDEKVLAVVSTQTEIVSAGKELEATIKEIPAGPEKEKAVEQIVILNQQIKKQTAQIVEAESARIEDKKIAAQVIVRAENVEKSAARRLVIIAVLAAVIVVGVVLVIKL